MAGKDTDLVKSGRRARQPVARFPARFAAMCLTPASGSTLLFSDPL
jgi:hypothetical protein